MVLTPLSCFPSFPAFLFSTVGKLSADPLSSAPFHCGAGYTRATFSSIFPLFAQSLHLRHPNFLLFLHRPHGGTSHPTQIFSLAPPIILDFTVIALEPCSFSFHLEYSSLSFARRQRGISSREKFRRGTSSGARTLCSVDSRSVAGSTRLIDEQISAKFDQ